MKKMQVLMPEKGLLYGYLMPLLTIAILVVLVGISLLVVWYQTKEDMGQLMAADIAQLGVIFERIEKECTILELKQPKNPINFLTIKKDGFVGSEVGSLVLAHPHNWQGPYLQDNPEMQGVEYQIVQVRRGYFIIPGDSVRLPNGAVVGKDIVIDEHTDMYALMADQRGLFFEGKPLAVQIQIGVVPVGPVAQDLVAEDVG